MPDPSLYQRLGGYDAIAAVADAFLARVTGDDILRRFWDHRGEDGVEREKQLLIDFLCASAGGPLLYTGRDMKTTHKGMGIGEDDWRRLLGHLSTTLDSFDVPEREKSDVLAFIDSTKAEIVEVP
ncbi:MAG: group 1 truncated hemoglobin [Proteobacteria bacterium]|nr:group 1 truncated hemoglobin [Pseudomonadota bacterium]MCH8095572.1 group 1 truncated hemoglobin [Pseudomonadota bacterium]